MRATWLIVTMRSCDKAWQKRGTRESTKRSQIHYLKFFFVFVGVVFIVVNIDVMIGIVVTVLIRISVLSLK